MDITTTPQSSAGFRPTASSVAGAKTGEMAPRGPLRLDAASWVAVAAFVAYIGIGLLA